MTLSPSQPGDRRRLLRKIHSWTGLILCLPLALLGLTGSILVFADPLERLLEPGLHRAVATGPAQPAGAIVAAAQKSAPADLHPTLYIAPSGAGDSASVRFGRRGAGGGFGQLEIFVDPADLTVLGSRNFAASPIRFVHALHENLATASREGRSVVGWLGVAMVLLCLTGPILWFPADGKWRAAFSVRRAARGYRLFRELHGAAGIWGVALFAVVSATGIYLAFPQATAEAVGRVMPTSPSIAAAGALRAHPIPGATPIDIDAAIALAAKDAGDARLRLVVLPQRPDDPLRVGFLADLGPSQIVIDPWQHSVMQRRASTAPGDVLLAWLRALHVGSAFGWPYRVLVFAVGFLPPLFAVTGIAMWLTKRRARRIPANTSAGTSTGAPAE